MTETAVSPAPFRDRAVATDILVDGGSTALKDAL